MAEETQNIVKNLIAANTPEIQEEIKKEIQEEPSVEIKDDSKIEDSLVTEELAKLMGLPKGLIGQPLSQVGKSYRQSLSWGNENNKKLIQLETKLTTLEGQLSQSQISKAEEAANKETKDQLGKMPDIIQNPEEFALWLEKRDQIKEEKLLKVFEEKSKGLLKSVDDNPILRQAQEINAERQETLIYQKIQEALPKDMKVQEILDGWFEDNEEDYEYMVKQGVYKDRPQKFVRDVLTWLKARSYDNLKNQKESEITKKIHKNTKENLEKVYPKIQPSTPRLPEEEKADTVASRIRTKLERERRLSTG